MNTVNDLTNTYKEFEDEYNSIKNQFEDYVNAFTDSLEVLQQAREAIANISANLQQTNNQLNALRSDINNKLGDYANMPEVELQKANANVQALQDQVNYQLIIMSEKIKVANLNAPSIQLPDINSGQTVDMPEFSIEEPLQGITLKSSIKDTGKTLVLERPNKKLTINIDRTVTLDQYESDNQWHHYDAEGVARGDYSKANFDALIASELDAFDRLKTTTRQYPGAVVATMPISMGYGFTATATDVGGITAELDPLTGKIKYYVDDLTVINDNLKNMAPLQINGNQTVSNKNDLVKAFFVGIMDFISKTFLKTMKDYQVNSDVPPNAGADAANWAIDKMSGDKTKGYGEQFLGIDDPQTEFEKRKTMVCNDFIYFAYKLGAKAGPELTKDYTSFKPYFKKNGRFIEGTAVNTTPLQKGDVLFLNQNNTLAHFVMVSDVSKDAKGVISSFTLQGSQRHTGTDIIKHSPLNKSKFDFLGTDDLKTFWDYIAGENAKIKIEKDKLLIEGQLRITYQSMELIRSFINFSNFSKSKKDQLIQFFEVDNNYGFTSIADIEAWINNGITDPKLQYTISGIGKALRQ